MASGVLVGDITGSGGASGQVALHRRDVYDTVVGVLLVLFLVFFFVGSRFRTLGLPGRMEDIIYILLLPFGYRYLPQKKNLLFWLIAAYFGMSVFPYIAEYYDGGFSFSIYPIIAFKELQYFYIAFLICQNRAWWVLATVDAMTTITIANGIRLILQGSIDYYGIGSVGTYQAPSLAGALYLFSTIWLHIRSKLLPNRPLQWMALGVAMLGAVCVVATVSRASIGALTIYLIVYMLLTLNVLGLAGFITAVGVAPKVIQAGALMFGTGYGLVAARILRRATVVGLAAGATRTQKWSFYLNLMELPDWVVGKGKGYPNAMDGDFGLGVDSQYVRTIVENGLVGMALIAAIFLTMLFTIQKRGGEYAHAWAVVMAMLLLAVPVEALQVSKSGTFFWLIMFYLYFCQRRAPVARPAS
jgi:hypothetical protein